MVWPRRIAASAATLSGALLLSSATFAFVAPTATSIVNLALGLAVAPVSAVLGVIIAGRPAAPRVGVLLAIVALAVSATVARETGAQFLAGRPDDAASLSWLVALLAEGAVWILVTIGLLLLYFPDGRLPGRRWRWVPGIAIAAAIATQAHGAFDSGPFRAPLEHLERPFGPPPMWLELLGLVAFVTLLTTTIACAISLIIRFRRSDHITRAQIKWLALGGLGVALYPFVCGVEILLTGSPGWFSAGVGIAGLVGVPVGAAIATLRYDLYDVDKAIAGTVVWGLLTVVLIGTYGLATVAAGVVLGQESAIVAAATTAICALGLSPIRHRLQRMVDRRLYPRRRAAFEALDALYSEASSGRAQPEALQGVLRTALRDDGLVVGYRVPGSDEYVDPAGRHVSPTGGCLVELEGRAIGVLIPSVDGSSEGLLREVAGRVTALVEVIRLRSELARALREVEASRARLVQVGYEERRRLERDLHDGAQQRLVSLGLAIRLAQRRLDTGTVDVPGLLDESVAQLSTAVAELRQIAQGIRPSSLDDGLEAAVVRLVQNVPVAMDMEVLAGPLPDDVATTAYFVISEAVANAVKHANASRIGLRVVREDSRVLVQVSDDGRGGASQPEGSGIADRVAALGGSLAISSPVGRGTIVEATIPCAS
jgi:signal transduction histidine kinase